MNDCFTCGRAVRMRAMRVSFNRQRGVAHWLQPLQGETCPCLKDWAWVSWRSEKSNITQAKIAEWNALNIMHDTALSGEKEGQDG